MKKVYSYVTHVSDGLGVSHNILGFMKCEFHEVFDKMMLGIMQALAIKCDGVECPGPFNITKVIIELQNDQEKGN